MSESSELITRLSEYKSYPHKIPSIQIDFSIYDDHVLVSSLMRISPPKDYYCSELILRGNNIDLESVFINQLILKENQLIVEKERLILKDIPDNDFNLSIISKINPFNNDSLEGLYISEGMLVTQCEAEGFRRICFHPDRPDVLSIYRVSIEADIAKFPVLLSNGNKVSNKILSGNSSGRHVVSWEDPYPKPSYLFALVAGKLEAVSSNFITKSGKNIMINLYVENGDQLYTKHAISSLKKAMKWDEDKYNLEYDLNEFNIVAVRHFNMGAMENKSLNIFNSKLVLADSKTATDEELERIESVIAHEYFHNWTGNRITCRDWFQLSLKEGLTVFRDQSFTADLHSAALKRIEDVSLLRNNQFKEDSGPTAHPVQPKEYLSIDNFYTTTIYEKGAELIRMLHVLLGESIFMAGISNYVDKFDGSYATIEEFIKAVYSPVSLIDKKFDIEQFKRWYSQIGTPHVSVSREWKASSRKLIIEFEQTNPKIKSNQPLVIPILISIIDPEILSNEEHLIVLEKKKDRFEFLMEHTPKSKPIISLFRSFSAPVTWDTDYSDAENIYLLKYDDDPFSRWDASQILMRKCLINRLNIQKPNHDLESLLISSLEFIINNSNCDSDLTLSKLISIPGFSEIELMQSEVDPLLLFKVRKDFSISLGKRLHKSLKMLMSKSQIDLLAEWPAGQAARRNIAIAWKLLLLGGDEGVCKEVLHAVSSNSMTLSRSALLALHQIDCNARDLALQAFYDKWNNRPVILDSWFGLAASMPSANGLDRVKTLLSHPKFDKKAPNAIRAVLGGFSSNIPAFHAQDGSGYQFMCDQLIELDLRNPITASRLAKVFMRWQSYTQPYKDNMFKSICNLSLKSLSPNTKEVINLILEKNK